MLKVVSHSSWLWAIMLLRFPFEGGGSGMWREFVRQLVAEESNFTMCDHWRQGMVETQRLCERFRDEEADRHDTDRIHANSVPSQFRSFWMTALATMSPERGMVQMGRQGELEDGAARRIGGRPQSPAMGLDDRTAD